MPQIFSEWQAEYAARGLPTFPINPVADGGKTKRPSVAGYQHIDFATSRQYAFKFTRAKGIACTAGTRNQFNRIKLVLADVDARGAEADRLAADFQSKHGRSRLIVRTGRDGRHLYYEWNGETRKIRPNPEIAIDILGSGMVVLPPSLGAVQPYEIIDGHLDNLTALTKIDYGPDLQVQPKRIDLTGMREHDGRNPKLFDILRDNGYSLPPTLDAFIEFAREINLTCAQPMGDDEVIQIANNVLKYRLNGTLRARKHGGVWFSPATAPAQMVETNLHLFGLIAWLKANNGPNADFWIANGLHKQLGWSEPMLAKARRDALDGGWIVQIVPPAPRRPAIYRWGPAVEPRGREKEGEEGKLRIAP